MECKKQSNNYLGLSDRKDYGIDSIRSTQNNNNVNSHTVGNMNLKYKYDVGSLFGLTGGLANKRIVGPQGTPQVDEDRVYFNAGNKIICLDRQTGNTVWIADYIQISTEAQKKIADKYPSEYNHDIVKNYIRSGTTDFAPITVFEDYVITGDSANVAGNSLLPELLTPAYFASRPQANGGPVLGPSYGITNNERHLLRNSIILLCKYTGKFIDSDRYSDSGEPQAQGYCNIQCILRMPTAFKDCENKMFLIAGCSIFAYNVAHTMWDSDPNRMDIGLLNNNRPTQKGGRVTKFYINKDPVNGKTTLSEVWRYYPVPKMLFKGDSNPYTGEIFQTDREAEEYNYHFDGVWGMRPTVDLSRRNVLFGTANGRQMPKEDLIAAYSAKGSYNYENGGQGYPSRSHAEWMNALSNVTSSDDIKSFTNDYRQTQLDKMNAIGKLGGTRYDKYMANSIVCLDLDTGKRKWYFRNIATDTFASFTFQLVNPAFYNPFSFPPVDRLAPLMKYQYMGESNDSDYGTSVVHVKSKTSDFEIYIAAGKDGTVQGFDPDNGKLLWYTRGGWPTATGAFNYAITTDENYVYGLVVNTETELGQNVYNIKYDPSLSPPVSITLNPYPTPTRTWYSDYFVDNWNIFSNGTGLVYENQNIPIDSRLKYIVKIDVRTGKLVLTGLVNGNTQVQSALNGQVASVSDLLLVAGGTSGKLYAFDTKNFEPKFEYNAFADVQASYTLAAGDPGFPQNTGAAQLNLNYLECASSPIVAGNEMYFSGSGDTLITFSPSKYFYCFTI